MIWASTFSPILKVFHFGQELLYVQCTVIGNSIFSSYERIYFYMGENSAVWTNLAQWVDLGSSGMGSFTFGG